MPPTSSPVMKGGPRRRRTRRPDATWMRSWPSRKPADEGRLRRHRDRRRRAGRALRRRAGGEWPAGGAGRALAGRRRVLLLGVPPAEVDVEAALAWRDFMVSNYSDAGQERWLADNGIELLRGTGRLAGPGVVESTACATRPSTSSWRTAPIRSCHRSPGCES